ncbi:MAG: hypothetical protein ABI867_01230 [Kofleriaceae bacterium]
MRDAIAKVKAELGDQAVIISTRQVRKGLLGAAVEISAAIDDGDSQPQHSGPSTGGPVSNQPPIAAPQPRPEDIEKVVGPLRSELRSLRAMVRTNSTESRTNGDLKSEVAALRKLVEDMKTRRPDSARRSHHDELNNGPLVAPSEGRVLMLVGPTGAGKTTTIAKLAANAALVDNKRVRLVTLDNYRVGGVDQIRTFADLIGVPLEVAESPADLTTILDDDSFDLTLIDTAGRSPRDLASVDELAAEMEGLAPIEVHLVVPAAASREAIDELANRYRKLAPSRLLFTKLDEVERCAELLAAPSRTNLPITWVTTGQDVPEDIEEPTSARVLELASGGFHARQRVA